MFKYIDPKNPEASFSFTVKVDEDTGIYNSEYHQQSSDKFNSLPKLSMVGFFSFSFSSCSTNTFLLFSSQRLFAND